MQKSILIFTIVSMFHLNTITGQERTVHTVILDLSDRILGKGQVAKDIVAIEEIFNAFEEQVRKKFYIKSKDAFQLLIIPQRSSSLDENQYHQLLNLDLAKIPMGKKVKKVKALHDKIHQHLTELYTSAKYSEKPSDYSGVDIWQFFNETLEYHLPSDDINKVYLLTDGYMDFENYRHQLIEDNLYTSTSFINHLRIPGWKEKAVKGGYGILPIRKSLSIDQFQLIGLKSKVHDLREIDRLKYFWEKWLSSQNIFIVLFKPQIS